MNFSGRNLGPLASLPGSWKGTGFSVMWRPRNFTAETNDPLAAPIKRYLMLNKTSESFDFHVIPGQVPNRGLQQGTSGSVQEDIFLYGLHYLQRVSDDDKPGFLDAGQALHIEPGLFMYVPPNNNSCVEGYQTTEPTIVRMGSIPHGVNVLMQGTAPSPEPATGPLTIPDTYPIPSMPAVIPPGNPESAVPGAGPGDPAVVGLGIQLGSITIPMTTEAVTPSVSQIPFLGVADNNGTSYLENDQNNCYVLSAAATFWLEWVQAPGEPHRYFGHERDHGPLYAFDPFLGEPSYLQLQYSQTVILVFNGIFWPYITVATMHLSNG